MYTPAEVTKNVVGIGKGKAALPVSRMLVLGIMAGLFIGLAAAASNTVSSTVDNGSLGRLLCGLVFPTGLTMVLLAGSELFTGNCLMVVPLLQREITLPAMLKNWIFVYIGNFIGSLIVVFFSILGRTVRSVQRSSRGEYRPGCRQQVLADICGSAVYGHSV